MKLGRELCEKVCEIPPVYISAMDELIQLLIKEKLAKVSVVDPSELPGLQARVQALEELKRVFPDAHKEAILYKQD